MKEFFDIPHMKLHRDDIVSLYWDGEEHNETPEFLKKKKEIESYSDEKMQEIAKKLSKNLMQDWDVCLRSALED